MGHNHNALTAENMTSFSPENRNPPVVPAANKAQAQALVLFSSLLSLCVSAGEWGGQRNAEPVGCGQCGDMAAVATDLPVFIPQGTLRCGCESRGRPPSSHPFQLAVGSQDLTSSPW